MILCVLVWLWIGVYFVLF